MSKTLLIFVVSIVSTVLLTIIGMNLISTDSTNTSLGANLPGTFYQPEGVAVNSTGHIFVADTQNDRIQVFHKNGTFITIFGFPGNSVTDGSLNNPVGITIDPSTSQVFVGNTFQENIKIFDSNGVFLKTVGTPGNILPDQFNRPSGIIFNATNDFYFVADTYNNEIKRLNSTDLVDCILPLANPSIGCPDQP